MRMLPAPRPRLVLSAAVTAIVHTAIFVGRVCAYDVPINTHKIDFWDTNQVGVACTRGESGIFGAQQKKATILTYVRIICTYVLILLQVRLCQPSTRTMNALTA